MERFILLEEQLKDFYMHILVESTATKAQKDLHLNADSFRQNKELQDLYTQTLRDLIKAVPVHTININSIIRELMSFNEIMTTFLMNNPKNKHNLTPGRLFEIVNALKRIRNKITHNYEGEISEQVFKKLSLSDKEYSTSWKTADKIKFVEISIDHIISLFDLHASKSYLYLSESINIEETNNKNKEIKIEVAASKRRINLIPFKKWVKKNDQTPKKVKKDKKK